MTCNVSRWYALGVKTIQIAVRISEEVVADLDDVAKRMRKREPGVHVSRADVVRMFLSRGLEGERALQAEARAQRKTRSA